WFQVGDDRTGAVVLREVKTGKEVFALGGWTGAVQAVAFSPDGRWLAVARGFAGKEEGAVLSVLDAEDGREVWQVTETGVQILSLAFSPDGRTIATGCGRFNNYTATGYARLLDAATGGALGRPIVGGPGGVLSVAFAPDGSRLALASRDV